jgi:hypothetical protein
MRVRLTPNDAQSTLLRQFIGCSALREQRCRRFVGGIPVLQGAEHVNFLARK